MLAQLLVSITMIAIFLLCGYQILRALKTNKVFLFMEIHGHNIINKNKDKLGFYLGIGVYCFFGFMAIIILRLGFV